MAWKALGSIIFGVVFGVMFIVVGGKRLLQAVNGPQKAESAIWSIVGILLGLACFAGVAWLMMPSPD